MGSKVSSDRVETTTRPRTFSETVGSHSSHEQAAGHLPSTSNNSSSLVARTQRSISVVGTSAEWRLYSRSQQIKCPICSKEIYPESEIEIHLVMCLTRPRLVYNEDVMAESSEASAPEECAICLEDLNPGEKIARLPCLCIYHKSCLDAWFQVNRVCPKHPD